MVCVLESPTMAEDLEPSPTSAKDWKEQLDLATKAQRNWVKRATKVVERYRDERTDIDKLKSRFNILWSNVQVLEPALYGRDAKPEVSRRFDDSNPVARLASTILERALCYEVEQFPDFHNAMNAVVEDRLLGGRGTVWLRYEPVIVSEQLQPPDNAASETPITVERIAEAHAPVDYVYWKDFNHSPARVWDEVWWVSRWVYMTKDEGKKRFGDKFDNVPLTEYKPDEEDKSQNKSADQNFSMKAKIAEIWDKRTRKVCWIAEEYGQVLDEREDPLQLEGFFPCPKPLYATMTNGTLIPVPDYYEYEDQARELDTLTGRITNLVRAVKPTGVYNGEFKELSRLLTEGTDNKLFPVTNWMALAEKGGLKGAVEMLDISGVIQALGVCYNAREQVKQTIYEICGISDIIRGTSKAEETLGAQQFKVQFGSMRLKNSQLDVARFASDIFQLKAQIMCRFYPKELLVAMSGIGGTDDGQDPNMVAQACQLLESPVLRDFQISISSDTLAQIDDAAERESAETAVAAIAKFMQSVFPIVGNSPELLPMVEEMLLYLVRRYRGGRALESSIERSMALITKKAQALAQNPPPNPEMQKAQLQQQSDQMRVEADMKNSQAKAQQDAAVQTSKLQAESQLEQMKMMMDQQSAAFESKLKMQAETQKQQFQLMIEQLKAQTQIEVAEIGANTQLQAVQISAANAGSEE